MAPNHIRPAQVAALDITPPPPPLPEKPRVCPPGAVKSICTLSNSSIPTLSSTSTIRLARQPSTSSSSIPAFQQSPFSSARKPVRSAIFPSSSRSALPLPALDPNQDHHRSDSGRSTGSSRSTATTDSFFVPQHPHELHRRLKDLPAPPSSSSLADLSKQVEPSDAPTSALGLNVTIEPTAGSAALPPHNFFRSKSSVSTTPTSPEEADRSPLAPPELADFDLVDNDEPRAKAKSVAGPRDGLDDFWKSDYSYARPSADLYELSLPPLMRSNAPIPPSRSQSLDPFSAPISPSDVGNRIADSSLSRHNLTLEEQVPLPGSSTPLVAANLRKLDSQHLVIDASPLTASQESNVSSNPAVSPVSPAQTLTTRGHGVNRLAVPSAFPYPQPTASASSSTSAIDQKSQPNKSTSSLSTSSTHEADKAALTTASKRSSASSSSYFRMTLSRQAKTLRNSFMWTPSSAAQPLAMSQDRITSHLSLTSPGGSSTPLSHSSSPRLGVTSPSLATQDLPPAPKPPQIEKQSIASASTEASRGHATKRSTASTSLSENVGTATSQKVKAGSPCATHSSANANVSSMSRFSASSSSKQPPTDYGKTEDRPRSRLSSRFGLHNSHWSMKISSLKPKKANDAMLDKAATPSLTTAPLPRASTRRSKSNAAISTASTVASTAINTAGTRGETSYTPTVRTVKRPGSLVIPPSSVLTSGQKSADSQLSPSFAETFAFLNGQIDSAEPSLPLMTVSIPPSKGGRVALSTPPLSGVESKPSSAALPARRRSDANLQTSSAASAASSSLNKAGANGGGLQLEVVPKADAEKPETPKETLFDHLADSPEAVYKSLTFPNPTPTSLPASQSLDSVTPKPTGKGGKAFGHKKQISLGSTTLISKSDSRKAADDLEKRVSDAPLANTSLPLANGRISTRSSFSNLLPAFTPVNEESCFFDALTSPLDEQPPTSNSSLSPDDSVLPTFATAADFFSRASTRPSSPSMVRPVASKSTTPVTGVMPSTSNCRTSLSRRLSIALESRSVRNEVVPSAQTPRAKTGRVDVLPARPETSLGFHLRNPLRRDRKTSVTKLADVTQKSTVSDRNENADAKTTASAFRKISSKLDRTPPATKESARPGTSLGFSTSTTGRTKAGRGFSSSVLAPTKSSLARSAQASPPSTGRPAVRSVSVSSLATPSSVRASSSSQRSPQRPANPPSSFRGSGVPGLQNGSPMKASLSRPMLTRDKMGSANPSGPQLSPFTSGSRAQEQGSQSLTALPQPDRASDLSTSPEETDVRRQRTLSKPILRPIRTPFAEDKQFTQPSTAMGFRRAMTGQDRKMSQPTLDMVDDREFLEALEQVRQLHRERIQAQAQVVENKTRLARLGMMSGNYLKTKAGSMLDDDEPVDERNDANDGHAVVPRGRNAGVASLNESQSGIPQGLCLRHKRSASADAKLGRSWSASSTSKSPDKDVDQRQKDIVKAYADKVQPVGPPTTGLEWGVGKASGKLHDGTFVNDDDWKKEVKALFLIRELVQTERSYARHLGSLLSVVRKMQTGPTGGATCLTSKRKSTSNLFATYSAAYSGKGLSNAAPPSHVALLKTYLPQLIALSNALVQRFEENPTSAGVGAAFDALSAQLESTFVGWSAAASQALTDLRSTELAKGKSPYKIGLVPLMPHESTEVGASSTTDASSSRGRSSPGSVFRNSTLRMTSLTRPTSPVAARHDADALSPSEAAASATLPARRSTKRRSTITSTCFIPSTSYLAPRVAVTPGPVLSTSPEEEKGLNAAASPDDARASATSSRRFAHSRSQSTLITPLPTSTSSHSAEPWLALTMTSPASQAPQAVVKTSKSLTPMDIAIMPTQRIPRYGLMLRDLLRNTPPESLSHARVQRATALIQKVALLCDSAAFVSAAPGSGAATPSRAGSVLGMTSDESNSVHASPLLTSSGFTSVKRN
ncbi:hypothetical protein NDA17_005662 [Ustilago hordei]|nr:hypothetical protein NDA17_005662 [Ustilago hordei]